MEADKTLVVAPTETELKKRFAVELLRQPDKPFKVAMAIFGDDTGRALYVSTKWPSDPEVKAFQIAAVEDVGDMAFLPTKADLAREAWNIATSDKVPVDDRLKAMRLYGDVRGFIEKGNAIINNNTNVMTNNKVMLVKTYNTTQEWEHTLAAQQAKLIHDADTTH